MDKEKIKAVIKEVILKKLKAYNPESLNMPFHYRLLGRDRMALYSFIHSLNTVIGTSIFEQVAELVAESKFKYVKRQYELGNEINKKAQDEIIAIVNELSTGYKHPDKIKEIQRIREAVKHKDKETVKIKVVKVDVFVEDYNNKVYLFDIKTTKPNVSNFKDFKKTLLEWVALYLKANPEADVNSYLAIPYNPYEPEPYQRWTMKGMIDLQNELLVAQEFWNFIGGGGAYEKILDCFEEVGIELRPILDEFFNKFRENRKIQEV